MGTTQSLTKATTTHPRFSKLQYGVNTDITVIHFELSHCQYKEWRRRFYEKFGEVKVLQERLQKLGQQQENEGSKSGIDNVAKAVQQRYPHVLVVSEKNVKLVRDGFCGDSVKLLLKVDKAWQTTLQKQIEQRHSISRPYSQQEIWLILLHLTQALLSIHQQSPTQILGNLHPTNILINVQGELAVISDVSLPNQKDHFATFKELGARRSFVSPELVGFLRSRSYKQYPQYPSCVDPQKAESFNLGLCLLQLCTLTPDLSLLYTPRCNPNYTSPQVSRQSSSRHNYTSLINQEYFTSLLHSITTRYSKMLSMVVKCLLEDRPEDRLSVKELWVVLLGERQGVIGGMDGEWFEGVLEGEGLGVVEEGEGGENGENEQEFNDGEKWNDRDDYYEKDDQVEGEGCFGQKQQHKHYYQSAIINSNTSTQQQLSQPPFHHHNKTNLSHFYPKHYQHTTHTHTSTAIESHILIWERSLEKQPPSNHYWNSPTTTTEPMNRNIPKVSFRYS